MINAFIPDAAATLKDEFSNWIKEKKNDSYYIENVKAKFMEIFGDASSVPSPFEKLIDIGPKLTDSTLDVWMARVQDLIRTSWYGDRKTSYWYRNRNR